MKNLHEIWGARFIHYVTELQKYMKYVFTGHLAIVLVFTIGGGGYAYSEWLKDVPPNFPAAILTALIVGAALCYSAPITLLKPADIVYFLPLEHKINSYFNRAIGWTFFSQLALPLILYVIALPLLAATGTGSKTTFVWLGILIVLLKWTFVKTEFAYRRATSGEGVWLDRIIRFIVAALVVFVMLMESYLYVLPIVLIIAIYSIVWERKSRKNPVPYEHFIELEQNRMMRFYRFANYFTDVPHLKGSVSRRGWLGFIIGTSRYGKMNAQSYLLKRTFIRTDDIFWLWVRLTILSVLGAIFIPFPIVAFVFTGALAFASAVQLIHALRAGDEFRMDMLFPEEESRRTKAIQKTVRTVQWIQGGSVTVAAFTLYGLSGIPFLLGVVVLIISEATIRLTGEKKEQY